MAPAAVAAAVLAPLPIGSLAAVFVGFAGLRQTKSGTMRGRKLAIGSMIAGALLTVGYGVGGVLGGMHYAEEARAEEQQEQRRWDRKQREREEEEREQGAKAPEPPKPQTPPRPSAPVVPPQGTVPQTTEERTVGDVVVVEVGVKEPNLKQFLVAQQTLAKASGKEVMIMTTRSGCDPCNGVMNALPDPLMQQALGKVRLVRVDIEVFRQELERMGITTSVMPVFALLRADGSPRDAIDGGEWGEDIPANVAPVLGPFVKGELKNRKRVYKIQPPSGTFL